MSSSGERTGNQQSWRVDLEWRRFASLVWLAAPGPFLGFMNSLFHGIDFTMLVRPGGFTWGGFFEALLVMSLWAFLAGAFFGWLRQLLDA